MDQTFIEIFDRVLEVYLCKCVVYRGFKAWRHYMKDYKEVSNRGLEAQVVNTKGKENWLNVRFCDWLLTVGFCN